MIKTCTTNDAFLSSSTLEGGSWEEETGASSQGNFHRLRLPPSARTLPWETERREREGKKGKEHRRRRRLEDTKREMLIHGRRVSSSFVSYLDDPLTILLFCTASILSWILSFAEAQRRIKEKSAHVQLAYLHFRWIVCLRKLVYSGADPPLSLSLSL